MCMFIGCVSCLDRHHCHSCCSLFSHSNSISPQTDCVCVYVILQMFLLFVYFIAIFCFIFNFDAFFHSFLQFLLPNVWLTFFLFQFSLWYHSRCQNYLEFILWTICFWHCQQFRMSLAAQRLCHTVTLLSLNFGGYPHFKCACYNFIFHIQLVCCFFFSSRLLCHMKFTWWQFPLRCKTTIATTINEGARALTWTTPKTTIEYVLVKCLETNVNAINMMSSQWHEYTQLATAAAAVAAAAWVNGEHRQFVTLWLLVNCTKHRDRAISGNRRWMCIDH